MRLILGALLKGLLRWRGDVFAASASLRSSTQNRKKNGYVTLFRRYERPVWFRTGQTATIARGITRGGHHLERFCLNQAVIGSVAKVPASAGGRHPHGAGLGTRGHQPRACVPHPLVRLNNGWGEYSPLPIILSQIKLEKI